MKWTFYKTTILHRAIIIYLIQLMIKAFDYSFGHFTDFTIRGISFTIGFILIWLLAWHFAEKLNKKIQHKSEILRLFINLLLGYSTAVLTNMAYRYSDIYIYNNAEAWKEISNFNPELTVSLTLIYMMVYGVFEYLNIKLQKKDEQLKAEKLLKENILTQYQSLKNQIEPHFLFNSLSVLSSIIHTNTHLAEEFVLKLSKTLRFIIEKNQFDLVPLSEELHMVEDYFFLLKTRFEEAIHLDISLEEKDQKDIYMPPASIQLLIENAIKHNKLSKAEPIKIKINICGQYICVSNKINKKNETINSTGIGLKNIGKRYELIANKSIVVIDKKEEFIVKLPVLNQKDYENFNH